MVKQGSAVKRSLEESKAMIERFLRGDTDPSGMQRKAQIRSAAHRLFVAQGFRKTSVAEVAKEAGVTKPTIYAYFENKTHLLLHALVWEKHNYLDQASELFDQTLSPTERLAALVSTSLKLARKMPLSSRLISGERDIVLALQNNPKALELMASAGGDDTRTAFHEQLVGEVCPELSRAERKRRATILAALVYCSGVFGDEAVRPGVSYDELADTLGLIIAGGIGAT